MCITVLIFNTKTETTASSAARGFDGDSEDGAVKVDDRKFQKLSRKVRSALDAVLEEARAQGCRNPGLYFEDAGSIYVVDLDDPRWINAHEGHAREAIILKLPDRLPDGSDLGAW